VTAKRLRLLHDLVPKAVRIAVLVNPGNAVTAESTLREVQKAAPTMGLQIQMLNATTARSMRPLPHLRANAPMPSLSLQTDSLTAGACNLSSSRHATGFRRFMRCVILWWLVV
jgi:ABC-type uncharacterized transport system substrate-binding protein